VDDTIFGNAVTNGDAGKAVDLNLDQATIAGNVNAEATVLEKGGKVDMEESLNRTTVRSTRSASVALVASLVVLALEVLWLSVRLVVCIAVKRLIGNDMVLQKCLEILLSVLAEKESVNPGAKLLEGEV